MRTTTTCVDPEEYARIFNEGYNEAHRQGVAGVERREWVIAQALHVITEWLRMEGDGGVPALAERVADAVLSGNDLSLDPQDYGKTLTPPEWPASPPSEPVEWPWSGPQSFDYSPPAWHGMEARGCKGEAYEEDQAAPTYRCAVCRELIDRTVSDDRLGWRHVVGDEGPGHTATPVLWTPPPPPTEAEERAADEARALFNQQRVDGTWDV